MMQTGKFINEVNEIVEGTIIRQIPEKNVLIAQDRKGYLHVVKAQQFVLCPNLKEPADKEKVSH